MAEHPRSARHVGVLHSASSPNLALSRRKQGFESPRERQ